MTDKTIENPVGKIGDKWFLLTFTRRSDKKLNYYLDQFNINDYYIIKATNSQRLVTNDELLNFKHASYMFFKKDRYDIDHIKLWLEWLKITDPKQPQYLGKPFPPFDPNIIKIKQ